MNGNRIWIELDRPPKDVDATAFRERQCELANRMLARLAGAPLKNNFFFVGVRRGDRPVYCFGGPMGYEELSDNGKWFNLDYLAGPEPTGPMPLEDLLGDNLSSTDVRNS